MCAQLLHSNETILAQEIVQLRKNVSGAICYFHLGLGLANHDFKRNSRHDYFELKARSNCFNFASISVRFC